MIQHLMDEYPEVQRYTVDLGDEIMRYGPAGSWTAPGSPGPAGDLYLVATGSVRLLAENAALQRTVSVAKLGPGQGFGGDGQELSLWGNSPIWPQPLPYWAKAAAPSQIVRIPAAVLAVAWMRWPTLRHQIQRQFQHRSPLAFFKQCTPVGTVPSLALRHHLLPRLVEYPLQAGTPLSQLPLLPTDCLWLRQGRLCNLAHPEQTLTMGDGWVCSEGLGGDWVAQTDSLLYRLPRLDGRVEG